MAVQRTVEVLNPEALRTERALRAFARIAVRYAFELHLYDLIFWGLIIVSKKRKCLICGRDLTGKNFVKIWDESQKKTVIVCRDDRSCYGSKMLRNYKTR